ncbi:MAG: polyamine aminopropyltransferase [Bacteroidetes bacterium]|nr:polyamine aminopropyltransferase [Rhodothermia bacterium]MCS7155777.1 polyamine aminopropyltransferase [Bacteroidota bacterium]MCX7906122.1 polyamine aminopropyltransferase [Bacteroidota bacterium]MDW8138250.1 polyamine aminopropyltransferase [Bacteroidota bacterium]MDW8285934.1 polyamine aminopropyltransferase [Bacteroidota bacterium]
MSTAKFHQIQYTEYWEGRTGQTFGVEELLYSRRSPYQQVQVWQTDAFGRILTLDGLVMLTERDEFIYHEMISHPALCLLEAPRRVLVVGGGDGGTVREVLRHPEVEQVDLVEIDAAVVEAARAFFPNLACAFDDPRLRLHLADGVAFARQAPSSFYDVVIVDSTDPIGIAEGLFGEAFYRDVARILGADGILVAQTESPFDRLFQHTIRAAHGFLRGLFPIVSMYLAFIPSYPTGMWSFTLASKSLHPVRDFDSERVRARIASFEAALRYYNPDVHIAAFALPNFVRQQLEA